MSSGKKKGKSIKLKEKALTLEEVFGQVALGGANSSGSLTPGLANIVLTPLSSEACLIHGINPDALRQRDFESFGDAKQADLDIQRLKYEAYERRRHELMKTALDEKKRLSKKVQRQCDLSAAGSDTMSMAQSMAADQEATKNAILEKEERRLAKVKAKQKKELLQMLQFEQKRDKLQADMRAKAERDALNEEKKKEERVKQERRAAEERRIRELRRKAQEDAEEEMLRIAARQRFEREREFEKDKIKREQELKKRAQLLEEEREKKKYLQRIKTEQQLEHKRLEIEEKIRERESKERERLERVELKRLQDQKELEVKKKETAKRIAINKEVAQKKEEDRKVKLAEKQALTKKQQDEIAAERDRERALAQRQREAMSRKKEFQAKATRKKEEEMKVSLLKKFEDSEHHLEQTKLAKQKKQAILRQEKALQLEIKKENVERIKRMQEYKRLETMRKVSENDKRTETLRRKQEELANQRRKAAVEAKIEKDKLLQALEKSKTSGGKGTIKKILASLEQEDQVRPHEIKKKTKRSNGSNVGSSKLSSLRKKVEPCCKGPPSSISINLCAPPDIPPNLLIRTSKKTSTSVEPYKSPYASPYTTSIT